MKKSILSILFISIFLVGCIKPYDQEELVTIEPSQTAFLIPLAGNTEKYQNSFDSMEFLEKAKVPTKRVKIAHQWYKTGRFYWQGKWIRAERIIIVERKPITREWTALSETGTSSQNQGIETESIGSIGFMIGLGITAQINEKDAVSFLYRYNNKPLSSIMDDEIRNMIESKFNEECSKRNLQDIMKSKAEILKNVRNHVLPYFKERGITITNLGYKGQFEYSDAKIQSAINKEFIADKEKIAQDKINEMEVEKSRKQAEAKRVAQEEINKMRIDEAKAEAKAMQIREKTLKLQMELKKIELQGKLIEKWNGEYPRIMTGSDSGLLLQLPAE